MERGSGAINLCVWLFGMRSVVLPSVPSSANQEMSCRVSKRFLYHATKEKAGVCPHVGLPRQLVVLPLATSYKIHPQHNLRIYL